MSSTARKIKAFLRRTLRPPLHKVSNFQPYMFLGTEYGGWPLLKETPRGSLVYSFGIGEDISFDIGAIETFDCRVHAFDPTPLSQNWVVRQMLPRNLTFHPVGVAGKDGEASFAPPAQKGHVSFSLARESGDDGIGVITAPVKRVSTFIAGLGGISPDIIKMDIEGFEYEVIDDILKDGVLPSQLLVEFHHDLYGFQNDDTRSAVRGLLSAGYELFFVSSSGREYGFCRLS